VALANRAAGSGGQQSWSGAARWLDQVKIWPIDAVAGDRSGLPVIPLRRGPRISMCPTSVARRCGRACCGIAGRCPARARCCRPLKSVRPTTGRVRSAGKSFAAACARRAFAGNGMVLVFDYRNSASELRTRTAGERGSRLFLPAASPFERRTLTRGSRECRGLRPVVRIATSSLPFASARAARLATRGPVLYGAAGVISGSTRPRPRCDEIVATVCLGIVRPQLVDRRS